MNDELLTKSEQARQLLRKMFAQRDRITIEEAVKAGAEIGVSRRTLTRACKDIGVTVTRNGPYPAFWQRP